MEAVNCTKLFQKYANQWIAMNEDESVICSGKTLDEVIEKANKKGCN